VNPEDLSNYKGGLPDDMAVISYIINDSLLYKFVVTNSTLEIVTTTLTEDINVQVNEFISALTSPDSGSGTGSLKVRAEFADKKKTSKKSFPEVSEKLYNILIADLLPVIGDKKKLCIIPSGKLSNIPFQCLGKKGEDKFRFLLEDYRVFYANRLDMFRSKDGSDRDISNMASFGNPDKSLEFAKKEVLDIQKVSHAKLVYVEGEATELKAKESLVQNKYVHFATHGTLDYVKPKQSYLTFTVTPGAGDDGRLTIAEIDSIKTGSEYAELVTLSACETARPLAISDDWYVSPANSFLRKKFKTVVASLWKVNDEATGMLMSEFYRNLEKMDKVDALRQAQETVSSDPRYTHPYYWGGFVLYGDWR
jgi:CHAT domain-containing protein